LADNLLAILCHSTNNRDVIVQVLEKIALLPRHDREDALTKFFILSGLRNFEPLILQEMQLMSTSFDIRDNSFLFGIFQQGHQEGQQQGLQQGLQQGEATILQRQLERKFGALPQSVINKINSADNSLEELFQ
jgi:predicted transposase YdaD